MATSLAWGIIIHPSHYTFIVLLYSLMTSPCRRESRIHSQLALLVPCVLVWSISTPLPAVLGRSSSTPLWTVQLYLVLAAVLEVREWVLVWASSLCLLLWRFSLLLLSCGSWCQLLKCLYVTFPFFTLWKEVTLSFWMYRLALNFSQVFYHLAFFFLDLIFSLLNLGARLLATVSDRVNELTE